MAIPRPALFAGPGRVGLFKSLKNLRGSDLRYAIGYNMSTLRMLGVPLAGLVSLPYDIQQTMNTFKRFSKTATTGSLMPSAQRIGVLSYAKNIVPKARGALPKTNIGAIDRYTSLYFGRQSRQVIKQINRGSGKKAALKAFFNPEVVDREIIKQAKRPTQQNMLHNWQMSTYMRAITGAPDPIRNNPFMQAKQYMARSKNSRQITPFTLNARQGIVDSKNEHIMMANERFEQIMGGLEVGAFTNPEAHIKSVMDNEMMSYMLETIDKDSAHLRTNLSKQAKAAHKARRRNTVQAYYAQSGIDRADGVGNRYNLSQENYRINELRNPYNGNLAGYSTDSLEEYAKKNINTGLKDVINSEPRFKQAMEGGMNDPSFAGLVNNLAVELGFSSQTISRNTPGATIDQLLMSLGNLGITMSLDTNDFQKAARNATLNFNTQIKSIVNFTREVDKLGMTSLSDALTRMIVSQEGLKELGKTGALEALEFSLTSRKDDSDLRSITGGTGEVFFQNEDLIKGDLIKVRQAANNEVMEHLGSGGGMVNSKTGTKLGNYFYSPHMKSGGMGVVESALHFYYDDERDTNNQRYYRSYQSMRYAENKRRALTSAKKGNSTVINGERYITQGGKAYKIQNIKEHIRIDAGDGTIRSINLIDGSLQNAIKRKVENLRTIISDPRMEATYGRGIQSLKYELAMLTHIESELVKGAMSMSFTGMNSSKKNVSIQKINAHSRMVEAEGIKMKVGTTKYGDITGNFSAHRVLQARPDKGHEFATALMEGQQIPNELTGWNRSGNAYQGGVTVSNEAQRRSENRRTRKPGEDNFIPNKLDIAKSIHIIPLNSKEARKGPGMLAAAVVAGTSDAKRNVKADAVRDIVALEYGGPATDSSGGYSRRTDGMFYLPSYFFTRAAIESAAYLGLDPGNVVKNNEKSLGRSMTMYLKDTDPNRKRARMDARQTDRGLKEIRKGQKNLRRAQNAFIAAQRKFARRSQDEVMRAMNRRSMKAFQTMEGKADGMVGNDRFIDPNSLLMESQDRFLAEGLAGMGAKEFNMTSLGIVKRQIGQAGIGGGFVLNKSTGKMTEITPAQHTSVYEVEGQSIVGRLPYMPVFDAQIYKRLLRTNSVEARKYLSNTRTRIGKFQPEYTQAVGDLLNNSEFMMQGLLGVNQFQTLKNMIGTKASHVRSGLAQAIGLNRIDIPNYQTMMGLPQGPNSEIGMIREMLTGGRAKSNLTTLYLSEMEKSLKDVMKMLPASEQAIIMQKVRYIAASTASKVGNAIQTVWARTSVGGSFGSPGDMMNALERTSILLEQGFASTTDTAGLLSAAFDMARTHQDKLKVAQSLIDTNKSRFIINNMNTNRIIEKVVDSDVVIQIGEVGLQDVIQEAIEQDNRIAEREQDDEFVGSTVGKLNYKSENIEVKKGVIRVSLGADMDEVIKEMKDIIFEDDAKYLQTEEIARQLSYKFSFSRNEGIYAEKLMEYYERKGTAPTLDNIGSIDGRSRDGSGVNVHDARKISPTEKFRNTKGEYPDDIYNFISFSQNAITETLSPENLAKDFFDKNLHLFVDPEGSLYDNFKQTRLRTGHTSLKAIEYSNFEGTIGAYFHKVGFEDSKRFILSLVNEARKGNGGKAQRDRKIFVEKFLQHPGVGLHYLESELKGNKGLESSNHSLRDIYHYYKSKGNRGIHGAF